MARSIASSSLKRPGALLEQSPTTLRDALELPDPLSRRVMQLLNRSGQLAIELERLASLGIWVLTQADDGYPERLLRVLGEKAPSLLFGAGEPGFLNGEGLAVVGSRDVDESGSRFAEEIGRLCARGGFVLVSGAARGVDRLSMTGALDAGGRAIGVLADSLERAIAARETRRLILEERLTLVTPFHPRAGFQVRIAMQRNKVIYGLAHYALVVSSSLESGGTWAGALEDLRFGWTPLYVRVGVDVPPGNSELLRRGALPFPDSLPESGEELRQWLQENAAVEDVDDEPRTRPDDVPASLMAVEPDTLPKTAEEAADAVHNPSGDLFPLVWPHLATLLREPRTERDIAEYFALEGKQVKAWLERAREAGLVRRTSRPIRYLLASVDMSRPAQESLFDLAS